MQRRVAVISIIFLLLASFSYAQVARNDTLVNDNAVTNFTNIGALGYDSTGNPGYLKLIGTDGNGSTTITYYLWVDWTGDLRIASGTTMHGATNSASFPSGDWRDLSPTTVVGSQS